jgi:hypothetical protein
MLCVLYKLGNVLGTSKTLDFVKDPSFNSVYLLVGSTPVSGRLQVGTEHHSEPYMWGIFLTGFSRMLQLHVIAN